MSVSKVGHDAILERDIPLSGHILAVMRVSCSCRASVSFGFIYLPPGGPAAIPQPRVVPALMVPFSSGVCPALDLAWSRLEAAERLGPLDAVRFKAESDALKRWAKKEGLA